MDITQQIQHLQEQMNALLAQQESMNIINTKQEHRSRFSPSLELISSQEYTPLRHTGRHGNGWGRKETLTRLSGRNYSHIIKTENAFSSEAVSYIDADTVPTGPFRRDEVMFIRMILGFELLLSDYHPAVEEPHPSDKAYWYYCNDFARCSWGYWKELHGGTVQFNRQHYYDKVAKQAFNRISPDAFRRLNWDACWVGDAIILKKLYNSDPTTGGTLTTVYETKNLNEPRQSYVLSWS